MFSIPDIIMNGFQWMNDAVIAHTWFLWIESKETLDQPIYKKFICIFEKIGLGKKLQNQWIRS